ncbi:MAG: response regulator [Thermoplasmata archaeon]|nr:response regulator [Thermoplasmata archaeon]
MSTPGWAPRGATTTAVPKDPAFERVRILVVEDSPSARKLLQEVLLRLGASLPNLRLSATVPEALQLFTQWRPDVVFVDLELRPPPDGPAATSPPATTASSLPKNGAELAVQFLAREPSLKVIVCSASDPGGTVIGPAVRSGKVRSIVKPVLAAKVSEALSAVLAPPPPPERRR